MYRWYYFFPGSSPFPHPLLPSFLCSHALRCDSSCARISSGVFWRVPSSAELWTTLSAVSRIRSSRTFFWKVELNILLNVFSGPNIERPCVPEFSKPLFNGTLFSLPLTAAKYYVKLLLQSKKNLKWAKDDIYIRRFWSVYRRRVLILILIVPLLINRAKLLSSSVETLCHSK